MLTLNNTKFEVDEEQSRFYVGKDEDQFITFSIDIMCKNGEYEGEICNPYVNINTFDTHVTKVQELAGLEVGVSTLEESDNREDTFYLYEHEPFVEYKLHILEVGEINVHIRLKGISIIDGYADPFIKAPFEADCWLRIR